MKITIICEETPTPASFNSVLALAAKRMALAKSQCFRHLHDEMRDEVYVNLDAVTLLLIREEIFPNLPSSRFNDKCLKDTKVES